MRVSGSVISVLCNQLWPMYMSGLLILEGEVNLIYISFLSEDTFMSKGRLSANEKCIPIIVSQRLQPVRNIELHIVCLSVRVLSDNSRQ